MERKTLSNNTEYQERQREARIKGTYQGRNKWRISKLEKEIRQLQQNRRQVSVTIGLI